MKLIQSHLLSIDKAWFIDLRKSEDNMTALHLACINNHPHMVQLLLDYGHSELNARSSAGQTPLNYAIARLNHDMTHMILAVAAAKPVSPSSAKPAVDLNMADAEGNTPLHCLMFAYSVMNLKASKTLPGQKPSLVCSQCVSMYFIYNCVFFLRLIIRSSLNVRSRYKA